MILLENVTDKLVSRLGKNINPHLQSAASKVDSAKSIVSTWPSLKSIMPCKFCEMALCFAIDNICGDISVANTWPLIPTRVAAVMAGSPMPVAISTTFEPSYISASSINLSLIF